MDRKLLETEIRENWFKEHKAILTQHGDLQVLQWGKPGTVCYYIRYVFDGHRMYITGDLGEALFCLTWNADVHSFNDIRPGYFHEKMAAYHSDTHDFNSNSAIKELRDWLNNLKDDEYEYDHDNMKELFKDVRNCSSKWELVEVIHKHEDWISEIDADYWEWLYNIGREYPARFISYLIGLQMASEQLKAQEVAE